METIQANSPRQGGLRPTTLYLRSDHWDLLKAIQQETGASPSFTARKLLDSLARKTRTKPRPPAA